MKIIFFLSTMGLAAFSPTNLLAVEVDRLWLPKKQAHLFDFLHSAAIEAEKNKDCNEVVRGGLNRRRSTEKEPVFTILCRKNFKSTFNLFFDKSDLGPQPIRPVRNFETIESILVAKPKKPEPVKIVPKQSSYLSLQIDPVKIEPKQSPYLSLQIEPPEKKEEQSFTARIDQISLEREKQVIQSPELF